MKTKEIHDAFTNSQNYLAAFIQLNSRKYLEKVKSSMMFFAVFRISNFVKTPEMVKFYLIDRACNTPWEYHEKFHQVH